VALPHPDDEAGAHTHGPAGTSPHPHGDHAGHRRERRLDTLTHRLGHVLRPHSHDSAERVDSALEGSRAGVRAVWISFAGLLATAVVQGVVVAVSGSVALLGDTLHNVADALTAVPLTIAFVLGRRAASRRFTYGLGRAEDLAGLVVLALIAASSVAAGWEAARRLLDPRDVQQVWLVAAAGVVGFIGNEAVARYRIRVGRAIGSAALIADGLHARTDALTSMSVLAAAAGARAGWRWADPVVGLMITVMIARVLVSAARQVFARILDAVDPALVDDLERTLAATPKVNDVGQVRVRWIGHALHADAAITADDDLTLIDAHALAHDAEHRLLHAIPRLAGAVVHVHPAGPTGAAHHATLAHHNPTTTNS
jgi:cation diffusion facilitator family transporter